jgi:NADH:ubiquinone oxidoreductase subunit 2 (subunit N)
MRRESKTSAICLRGAGLLLLLAASERALKAYADPGSGTLIWQVLVGAVIGVLYYARRVVAFFRKKDRKD